MKTVFYEHLIAAGNEARRMLDEFRGWRLRFPISPATLTIISVYEDYQTLRHRGFVIHVREKPISKWLLRVQDGSVYLFPESELWARGLFCKGNYCCRCVCSIGSNVELLFPSRDDLTPETVLC